MPTRTNIGVFLALGWSFGIAAGLLAEEPERRPEPAEPSRGAVLFRLHCASCHGSEGHGDGPVAEHLKTPSPDLTRIAARRGGRFPADEIERLVDGRTEVEPHGRAEMPVWGLSFRQLGRLDDQEEEIRLQVRHLVDHLRSIQAGVVTEESSGGSG